MKGVNLQDHPEVFSGAALQCKAHTAALRDGSSPENSRQK